MEDGVGGTSGRDWAQPDLHLDLARALDRACFDFVLMEDSSFVPDSFGGSMDYYLERAMRASKNDPMPLVPLMAQATKHLGIVPTISTSFYPPFLLARLMATLDLMTGGRVGCNFVTSTAARAAQNYGYDDHIEHDSRYAMADEFVEVCLKLWASWDADAIVMDRDRDRFVDPSKVRPIAHKGRFFTSRGPMNTAQPPQGHPVLVQAGSSPQGRQFGAHHMDVVIAAYSGVDQMREFCADLRRRLVQFGRDPRSCKIMFVTSPTLGETNAEARERYERKQIAANASPELVLARMAGLTDIDFSQYDIDAPLADFKTNGQQGTLKQFLAQGSTLREVARNYRYGLDHLHGTADSVAGQMAEIMEEVGGDGFILTGTLTRRYIAEIADGLTPALQDRGVVRTAYEHAQFRDNLMAF
ncbi:NtaA/DmoA family FMN-dependent monooxygenase [Acidisphaera sp. L21]|uniref:NtaA/DmoA family FMN-dependent monooxygenase n=1 Tax=Acidisphaera sp. L21 TaxID=1641851 RepID=UPI00131B4ED2|nr:NtaA/DmoA family FMN-dependent monooxygenase [Acidisphaera sp. L21]